MRLHNERNGERVHWREDADNDPLENAELEYLAVSEMPDDCQELSLETETMVVDERGVYWTGVVKHTDVRIESGFLPWDQIGL